MLRRFGTLALVSLIAASTVTSGCGTILGYAGTQPVNVHVRTLEGSDDKTADVLLDGLPVGKGTGTYQVDPVRQSHNFVAKTQDGRTAGGAVVRDLMPLVVVCDAILLLFPILIDYFDGGMYSWKPDLVLNL